jgi:hypothetical protein
VSEYYVTFGIQYERVKHPLFPEAHPDGWVTIEAPSIEDAYTIAFEHLDIHFGFIYLEGERSELVETLPRGELARWTA